MSRNQAVKGIIMNRNNNLWVHPLPIRHLDCSTHRPVYAPDDEVIIIDINEGYQLLIPVASLTKGYI